METQQTEFVLSIAAGDKAVAEATAAVQQSIATSMGAPLDTVTVTVEPRGDSADACVVTVQVPVAVDESKDVAEKKVSAAITESLASSGVDTEVKAAAYEDAAVGLNGADVSAFDDASLDELREAFAISAGTSLDNVMLAEVDTTTAADGAIQSVVTVRILESDGSSARANEAAAANAAESLDKGASSGTLLVELQKRGVKVDEVVNEEAVAER